MTKTPSHGTGSVAATQRSCRRRWPGWQDVVAAVELSQGIFLYPPPSTVGSSDVSKVARSVVSLGELLGTA
ncbi:MAG: hypothetical protein E7L00_06200 [Propionibacteriaceae bacterium]|nr:hypothetical protein [Propionibacteriaceae bacterium]